MPDPALAPSYITQLSLKYLVTLASSLTAVALTVWSWPLGLALGALTTAVYVLPPLAPRFKTGQEPKDELEEADERR